MKSKKFIAMTMAAALTLSLTSTALAAGGNIPGSGTHVPDADEIAANGNTTIGIMQAKVNPLNMSFEVPLYVTMAVVENDAVVKVPTNYGIKNTTTPEGGKEDYQSIGVVGMSFEKLATSTFNTNSTAAGVDDIVLTIGGVTMPTLTTAKVETVDITGVGSAFYTGGKPVAIPVTEGANALALPLAGTVTSATRTEEAAVAQFRVKYTLSLLNSTGDPLGSVYAGDDANAAGMPDLIPTPAP